MACQCNGTDDVINVNVFLLDMRFLIQESVVLVDVREIGMLCCRNSCTAAGLHMLYGRT